MKDLLQRERAHRKMKIFKEILEQFAKKSDKLNS